MYELVGKECFNSKLVRLKGLFLSAIEINVYTFQFQTGSIKSESTRQERYKDRVFQFQTGSIKS